MNNGAARKQYRALAGMMLRNQLRGRSGRSRYGRLLSLGITYAIAAAYLGWSLTHPFYEPAYLIVSFSVMLYIAGFTFISSYPLILLDKSDRDILQQFPISDRTLSLARMTNLGIYVVYVSLPFVIPLGAYYAIETGSISGAIVYAAVMLAASAWATLFFLLLTIRLLQRSPRFQVILSGMQMALVFGLLIFYQAMPRYFIHDVQWDALFASAYAYILPPFWFIGIFGILAKNIADGPAVTGSLLLVLSTIFMVLGISRSWALPLDALLKARKTRTNILIRALDTVALRWTSRSSVRAGYEFFTASVFRDRTIRLQILPMALMPAAAAVYGILSGELSSPFPQILTGWYSKMHIPVMVFFLFIARHSEHVVMFSPVKSAQWIMHTQSRRELHGFRRGVRLGIAMRILLPIAIILFMLFTVTMPIAEAALQAVFVFLSAMMQSAAFGLLTRHMPFTQDINQLEAFRRISQLFIVIPFLIVFWVLHYFTSASYISFVIMLTALALTSVIMTRLARRRSILLPAW